MWLRWRLTGWDSVPSRNPCGPQPSGALSGRSVGDEAGAAPRDRSAPWCWQMGPGEQLAHRLRPGDVASGFSLQGQPTGNAVHSATPSHRDGVREGDPDGHSTLEAGQPCAAPWVRSMGAKGHEGGGQHLVAAAPGHGLQEKGRRQTTKEQRSAVRPAAPEASPKGTQTAGRAILPQGNCAARGARNVLALERSPWPCTLNPRSWRWPPSPRHPWGQPGRAAAPPR